MTDLVLTREEIRQGIIDERRTKLMHRFEAESGQGILPYTNDLFFEQNNSVIRSALFSAGNMGSRNQYLDWTEIFCIGGSSILYRGPGLTVDHEVVLVRIMVLARGRSLTKPVQAFQADILRWLNIDDSGANFKKARKILDDLSAAEVRITSKPALKNLLKILTSPSLSDMADGKFFKDYVNNRFGSHLKMIAEGLQNDQPISVSMRFLTSQTHNSTTGRMMLNLDPIAAIFFDGVNTTLLPFEVLDAQDRYGKKLLPFIASHRDGVFPIKLEKYHQFSGSKSNYQIIKRRFKSELKKRCEAWEANKIIVPGWRIERNEEGEDIVYGLKLGESVRIKSKLELLPADDIEGDYSNVGDETAQGRLNDLADRLGVERPSPHETET
jgi:hypothetical protein